MRNPLQVIAENVIFANLGKVWSHTNRWRDAHISKTNYWISFRAKIIKIRKNIHVAKGSQDFILEFKNSENILMKLYLHKYWRISEMNLDKDLPLMEDL